MERVLRLVIICALLMPMCLLLQRVYYEQIHVSTSGVPLGEQCQQCGATGFRVVDREVFCLKCGKYQRPASVREGGNATP